MRARLGGHSTVLVGKNVKDAAIKEAGASHGSFLGRVIEPALLGSYCLSAEVTCTDAPIFPKMLHRRASRIACDPAHLLRRHPSSDRRRIPGASAVAPRESSRGCYSSKHDRHSQPSKPPHLHEDTTAERESSHGSGVIPEHWPKEACLPVRPTARRASVCSSAMSWLKDRWGAHVERVKMRRWNSVAYESDNEGLELPTDDNELSTPGSDGPSGREVLGSSWATGEAASQGAFGTTTPRPTSGPE
jgi:hypothetical protein